MSDVLDDVPTVLEAAIDLEERGHPLLARLWFYPMLFFVVIVHIPFIVIKERGAVARMALGGFLLSGLIWVPFLASSMWGSSAFLPAGLVYAFIIAHL